MAVTENIYIGNGSSTNYSFTFPYLETTDIKVTLDGVLTTAYTLPTATTIQLNAAPILGTVIRIYRDTDDSTTNATFYPGSAIRAVDLNDNFTQTLYLTQESDRNANEAITTSIAANSKSDQAINAVANALLFTIVPDVASIPGSPANSDAVEVTDSTGIESFTPLANIPIGFIGDSCLGVRIIYDATGSTWNWLQYFPQDPETRYGNSIANNAVDIANLQSDVLNLDSTKLNLTGGTMTGDLLMDFCNIVFEGITLDNFETTLTAADPTADRTITLPDESGNVIVSGNASIVDADISASAEITVSKLADGAARQLLQTDAAGTGVEWTDNVDIPGTLDVTGAATFDSSITIADGSNIVFDTTTGTKIGTATSQKLGFYNSTPVVQPTTGVAEAAFVENSGGTAVNVDSTFGGYTIQQIVQALQTLGLIA